MEKLICPECGKKVTPNAESCENCGCKISVCPDCGAVYKVGQAHCTDCGRILSEEANHNQVEEDMKKVEDRNNEEEKREKTLRKYNWIETIVSVLCIGIPFIVYFIWKNKNDLDALSTMQTCINLCKAPFIILGIFGVAYTFYAIAIKDLIYIKSLIGWIKNKKFDYREYIRLHGEESTENTGNTYTYAVKLSKAALHMESKKTDIVINLLRVFKGLASVALHILLICYLLDLIPQAFASRFASVELELWTPVALSCVIIVGVLLLQGIITDIVYSKLIDKKRKEILASAKK